MRTNASARKPWRALIDRAAPLLSIVALVVLWDLAVRAFELPVFLLPPPSAVWEQLVDQLGSGMYQRHTIATMEAVLLGYAVATVAGMALGVGMASWRTAYRLLYPPIVASQGMPKTAVAPLLLLWFGFGMTSKVIIAGLIAFFPIVVSTFHGLSSVPVELQRLGRSIGLRGPALFWKIRLPAALPEMFSGFKVGITLAIVGAIVAEFVAANEGLGYMLILSMAQMNTAVVIATLCILGIAGIVLYAAIDLLERLTIPWHVATGRDRQVMVAGG